MGFLDTLLQRDKDVQPENILENYHLLNNTLVKCREYQDKGKFEKCSNTFNNAQKYFNKIFEELSQESLNSEYSDDIGEMCSFIDELSELCVSYYSWPSYFDLDFSEDENNTFAYLNYLRGKILFDGEKYHAAIKYLEDSLTYDNDDYHVPVYNLLGKSYQTLEKYRESLSAYNHSIDKLWENPEAWEGKALVLLDLCNYKDAKSSAEVALELISDKNDSILANFAYAYSLCMLGEYEQAFSPISEFIDASYDLSQSELDDESNKAIALIYYMQYLSLKGTNSLDAESAIANATSYYKDIENTEEGNELKSAFNSYFTQKSTPHSLTAEKDGYGLYKNDEEIIDRKIVDNDTDTLDNDNEKLSKMLSKLTGNGSDKSLENILQELNSLIGLSSVKREVEGLINVVKNRKRREELGLKQPELSLHMVFSGNPGTGKTTVARLIAEIYHELGLISGGQLIEVDRSKLVAGYVGQTAIQTKEVIDSAIGGILFIDEAYTLSNDKANGDNFGQEAIDTLLKSMEDNRDNLIVIVAGYPDLMKEFLASNPGLESRFNTHIHFDDYSAPELLELLKYSCKKNGMSLSQDAETYAKAFFEKRCENLPANFANGRYVRNIFEKLCRNQDNRVAGFQNPTRNDLSTLTLDDFDNISI